MNRRQLVLGAFAAGVPGPAMARRSAKSPIRLVPSGPVASQADGEIIENLDIGTADGDALVVRHRGVLVRNCRIRHAGGHGVHAVGAPGLLLRDIEIEHVGAPAAGAGPSDRRNNVNLENCPGARLTRIKASRGSSNIYAVRSERLRLSGLELHDARGPTPRGQNVQLDKSPSSLLENFSAENSDLSWTEDNISIFRSSRCLIRNGLLFYNNSPTGDGIMIEGSFDCVVADIDAVQQGNGAFAAVPQGNAGSGGCVFLRCRTRASYNSPRDGREAPSSDGLSFFVGISPGGQKHRVIDCRYDALANPDNLIWDPQAVGEGWSITPQAFESHRPLRLAFGW